VGEKPDIDNDRSNPAYIPRKGMFYEHDLRIGDGGNDEKEPDVTGFVGLMICCVDLLCVGTNI